MGYIEVLFANIQMSLNQFQIKRAIGEAWEAKSPPIWAAYLRTHLSTERPPPDTVIPTVIRAWVLYFLETESSV